MGSVSKSEGNNKQIKLENFEKFSAIFLGYVSN